MIKLMTFDSFNERNFYNTYIINIREIFYEITLLWNKYAQCTFLSISDTSGNKIISSKALVNNLRIRHKDLPTVLVFTQKDFKSYEPTLNSIEKDFVLMWQEPDNEEEQ